MAVGENCPWSTGGEYNLNEIPQTTLKAQQKAQEPKLIHAAVKTVQRLQYLEVTLFRKISSEKDIPLIIYHMHITQNLYVLHNLKICF